jgi:hypothetical protein
LAACVDGARTPQKTRPPHPHEHTLHQQVHVRFASCARVRTFLSNRVKMCTCDVCTVLQSHLAGSDGCTQQQHHEKAASRAQVSSCTGVAAEEAARAAARGAGGTQGTWLGGWGLQQLQQQHSYRGTLISIRCTAPSDWLGGVGARSQQQQQQQQCLPTKSMWTRCVANNGRAVGRCTQQAAVSKPLRPAKLRTARVVPLMASQPLHHTAQQQQQDCFPECVQAVPPKRVLCY